MLVFRIEAGPTALRTRHSSERRACGAGHGLCQPQVVSILRLVYEPPFLGSMIWSALCVGEDIAALAPHRPVRLRKLMRNGDVVHDPRHARGFISNRLRRLAL